MHNYRKTCLTKIKGIYDIHKLKRKACNLVYSFIYRIPICVTHSVKFPKGGLYIKKNVLTTIERIIFLYLQKLSFVQIKNCHIREVVYYISIMII